MYHSQLSVLFFHYVDGLLSCANALEFGVVPFIFSFVSLSLGRYIRKKLLLREMSEILLSMFSYRIFIVLSLTFTFLIHCEFIIVYGVRRWSGFIFFHVSVQFSLYHLLNRLALPHCMFLLPLPNIN